MSLNVCRNLDAVLLATSKTDLDGFTASMGLSDAVGNSGSYGGAYSHPKAVGASPGVTARKASTSAVAQAPGPLLRSRGATSLRAPLGDDQIEEASFDHSSWTLDYDLIPVAHLHPTVAGTEKAVCGGCPETD